MSLFLTGSCNVRVRRKISHRASVALHDCETTEMCVGLSRYPGRFAKQLDPHLMSAKDYA